MAQSNENGAGVNEADYGPGLLPQHSALLAASAILPDVAAARGYRSVTARGELSKLGFKDYQCRAPALLIPIYDATGRLVSHQIRPDAPRMRSGRALKYEACADARNSLDVNPHAKDWVADHSRTIYFTEGCRKSDSAISRGLACISLAGVWGWRGQNGTGGSAVVADLESIPLKDRQVIVVFDSDVMTKKGVATALRRLAGLLHRRGASVRIAHLPGGPDGAKTGLDDYFASGRTVDDLLACVRADLPPEPLADDQVDVLDGDLRDLADRTWDALSLGNEGTPEERREPRIFRFVAAASRVVSDSSGAPTIEVLAVPSMRHAATQIVRFVRVVRDGEAGESKILPARPPRDLIEDLIASPAPRLPELQGILDAPTLSKAGKLIVAARAGFDHESGFYFSKDAAGILPPPERPSADDVRRAVALIDELICDFQFAEYDDPKASGSNRANSFALLLTPLVAEHVADSVPLFVIRKPAHGSGATLLAQVLTLPGAIDPKLEPWSDNREEMRKRIFADLLSGSRVIILDNLSRNIDSAALAGALTAGGGGWRDRVLGESRMATVLSRCTWVATSNNATFSSELTRRIIPIELQPKMATPEARTGFKHVLPDWAREHRKEIARAALTVIQNWVARGRPGAGPVLGSYQRWADTVGGILREAGIPGFLENRTRFAQRADVVGNAWRAFAAAWWESHGEEELGVADLLGMARHVDGLRLSGEKDTRAESTSLGCTLRSMVGKLFPVSGEHGDGDAEVQRLADNQGAAQYRLKLQVTPRRETDGEEASGEAFRGGQADDDARGSRGSQRFTDSSHSGETAYGPGEPREPLQYSGHREKSVGCHRDRHIILNVQKDERGSQVHEVHGSPEPPADREPGSDEELDPPPPEGPQARRGNPVWENTYAETARLEREKWALEGRKLKARMELEGERGKP